MARIKHDPFLQKYKDTTAYDCQSVIITSNRPFQKWSGLFYDAVIVTAILDRVLQHAYIFNMKGDIYRLREYMQVEEKNVIPLS